MKNIQERSISIVLVGSFNPAIFHPSWFSAEGILGHEECATAELEVTHNHISIFTCGLLRFECTRDRLVAKLCQDGFDELLRDFAVNVLKKLSHTPIRAVGLNHDLSFSLDTSDQWHALGHKLAPKEGLWDEDILKNPGTKTLTIIGKRADCDLPGDLSIRVEPTTKCSNGVYIDINDHYALTEESSALDASKVIENQWVASLDHAERTFERIYAFGTTSKD